MDLIDEVLANAVELFPPATRRTIDLLPVQCPDLSSLLLRSNGLIAFDGSLHVFGWNEEQPSWNDALAWNSLDGWRLEFGDLLSPKWWALAETAFGDQFFLRAEGDVVRVLAETGHIDRFATSFSEFLSATIADPDGWLDRALVRDWQLASNRRAGRGRHLCPRIPFSLGGEVSKSSDAYLCEPFDNMAFKGQLARQLALLKPGDKVNLKVVNLPAPLDS